MAKNARLLSIRLRFAKLIFAETKLVELRRLHPKVGPGDLVFMYVPSPVKAVQGAFEVKKVLSASPESIWHRYGSQTGLSKKEFHAYFKGKKTACAILISRCWKFPQPLRLEQLRQDRKAVR